MNLTIAIVISGADHITLSPGDDEAFSLYTIGCRIEQQPSRSEPDPDDVAHLVNGFCRSENLLPETERLALSEPPSSGRRVGFRGGLAYS